MGCCSFPQPPEPVCRGKPPQRHTCPWMGLGLRVPHLLSMFFEKLLQVPRSQFVKSFPRYIWIRLLPCFKTSHGSQCQRAEPYTLSLVFKEACDQALSPSSHSPLPLQRLPPTHASRLSTCCSCCLEYPPPLQPG